MREGSCNACHTFRYGLHWKCYQICLYTEESALKLTWAILYTWSTYFCTLDLKAGLVVENFYIVLLRLLGFSTVKNIWFIVLCFVLFFTSEVLFIKQHYAGREYLLKSTDNHTFSADAGAVDVPAGDLVVAGARGGAVGPVEACGTADGAVVALETEDRQTDGNWLHIKFNWNRSFLLSCVTHFVFHIKLPISQTSSYSCPPLQIQTC